MKKQLIRPLQRVAGTTLCSPLERGFRATYPGMLLCYREKLDSVRLGGALARVLIDFPMYAGKLFSEGADMRIRHGAGAAVLESARRDVSIETLAADIAAGRADELDPQLSKLGVALDTESLLGAKLTTARNGSVLCVVWHHIAGDMHSTMLLMRAWAQAYNDLPYEKPTIVLDRDAYLREVMPDPAGARSAVRLASWRELFQFGYAITRPAKRITVEYTWEQLHSLQDALSESKHVTINDAVCSHVFHLLRQLSGTIERTNLCMTINYRKRVGIPESTVGNMVALVAQPTDEIDEPCEIAAGLRIRLEQYAAKHVDYQASMRMIDAHPSLGERLRLANRLFEPNRGDLLVTNWNGFGTYDLMFGSSKPIMFCPLSFGVTRLPAWFCIVYDLPEAKGLGVTVGLPARLAERLESSDGQALLYRRRPIRKSSALQLNEVVPA